MRGLILAVLIIFLSSCTQMSEMIVDELFEDYPVITRDLASAWQETASFEFIPGNKGGWKSPKEFKRDGWGDCEDFATYLVYQLGPESQIAFIIRPNTEDTRDYSHAVVLYKGQYLEPQKYGKILTDFELMATMSYDAVIQISTACYTK